MRTILLKALIALAVIAATSAQAISVTSIGVANGAAGALTQDMPVTTDSPPGNAIVVKVTVNGATAINIVTDTAFNTYVPGVSYSNGSIRLRPFICLNCFHLPVGGVITASFAGTGGGKFLDAATIAGVAAIDQQGVGVTGTGTSPSISTTTLAVSSEVDFGFEYALSAGGDGYAEAPGFASLPSTSPSHWGYQIVTSTAPIIYAPVLAISRTYIANDLTFGAYPPGGAHSQPLTGVGP